MSKLIYHCYCITNLVNGKKYIGQTTEIDPYDRWNGHKKKAKSGLDRPLYKDMRIYGSENFIFEPIVCCRTLNTLNETEKMLIIQYQSRVTQGGYNIRAGGNNGFHSESTKIKIKNGVKKSLETNHNFTIVHFKECLCCQELFCISFPKGNNSKKCCSDKCSNEIKHTIQTKHDKGFTKLGFCRIVKNGITKEIKRNYFPSYKIGGWERVV